MTDVDRARAIFQGHVQGVGFRYTAHRLALQYSGITGFVRNLPDGTVEILAEGSKNEVHSLLTAINDNMSGYISAMDMHWDTGPRCSDKFAIRV